jgi:hypothetical protein
MQIPQVSAYVISPRRYERWGIDGEMGPAKCDSPWTLGQRCAQVLASIAVDNRIGAYMRDADRGYIRPLAGNAEAAACTRLHRRSSKEPRSLCGQI